MRAASPPARRGGRIPVVIGLGICLAAGISTSPVQAQRKPPSKKPAAARAAVEKNPQKQLAQLARALRTDGTQAADARLSQFARRNAANALGARAALALGYFDYTKGRYAAAENWLARAQSEPVLREYVLYWQAETLQALGRHAEALVRFESFRREFPDSVMTEQALESLAQAALAAGQPARALAALDAYDRTSARPGLLLLRAQAREEAGSPLEAAREYQLAYYRFPLNDEAKTAWGRLLALGRRPGVALPEAPLALRLGRAEALYDARRWQEAQADYEGLLSNLTGAQRAQAELRLAVSRVRLGALPGTLATVTLTDPELDAERLYELSQALRADKKETEMLAAVEQLVARYPQSRWAEEALFAAGNYYWVSLDRHRASEFYRRVAERFPAGRNALIAQWRVAWTAYVERRPEAATLFEEHLRRYPGSPYTVDALYWLGRAAEHASNPAGARGFYAKARDRFPGTYFGAQADVRFSAYGGLPADVASEGADSLLAMIPTPPPLPDFDEPIPLPAQPRWERARALQTIAFDASAELELRAAYAATGVLRLLWEAARAAAEAQRYPVAIVTTRQIFPRLEARKIEELPAEVWRTAFPLPFESAIRVAAARNHLDPMLLAGLIRQESAFQDDAVSRAGAVGLTQVLPKTARKLALRLRLRYARARLFDPEYNLKLGALYLADLLQAYGNSEAALAAFNAGEDRVAAWQAEHSYDEPAEFVESIPFTETREYVQIVLRNAEVYRRLYGAKR